MRIHIIGRPAEGKTLMLMAIKELLRPFGVETEEISEHCIEVQLSAEDRRAVADFITMRRELK